MRAILVGDIIAAARALLAMPISQQMPAIRLMLDQAHAAHLYHKRWAKPHRTWGNGSLMSRAYQEAAVAEPFASNTEYLLALQVVIGAILDRKIHSAAGIGPQSNRLDAPLPKS